jgi:hypothetical protein
MQASGRYREMVDLQTSVPPIRIISPVPESVANTAGNLSM